ncbi:MAG: potassium channel family protein [Bacteroidota bacterium]|nr:potassium channel family protein [Bacteroidota bacterium]
MFGILFYMLIVLLFAIVYYATKSISHTSKDVNPVVDFGDSLYFSFVSFITIGYGDIAPNGTCGKMLLFFESIFFIGYNAVFAASMAFQLLKRSDDIIISNKIYIRKSNKPGFNNDENYDFIIRVGNKGNALIDCKGVLEFFVISNNVRTTVLKFEREYRALELTWNFKMRFYEPVYMSKTAADNKAFLAGFLTKNEMVHKQIRFSISGLDNNTGQVVTAFHVYDVDNIGDFEFIDKLVDVYSWNGSKRGKPDWRNFDKSMPMNAATRADFRMKVPEKSGA